ncbi:MAG: hypothetical protein KZQ76_02000 [Candidatus Thiodiazotropha sp. (ex Epidulcina cf. delphinae)]|nr:hypothetical protein [Candidatus Thiodiazotropha sp. (ex Epidulcina cf. delphinae)]
MEKNDKTLCNTTAEVTETSSKDGTATRTCSGKCGDTKVDPIDCPPGHSPILDCTSNPPTISCYDHRKIEFSKEQLRFLTEEISASIRGGQAAARNTVRGAAGILGDDCSKFSFEVNGNQYSFSKAGHESWVETVKYSKRHNTDVNVVDNGIKNSDGKFKPLEIYDA